MRSIQATRTFAALFLLLFLVGCGGSSGILERSYDRPVSDEVTGALQQVILPALKTLASFSPVNQPAPPRGVSSDSAVPACARFDPLCRSGRYEVCSATREETVVFRFERCARSSGLLNGRWELTRDGLLASATFDLALDDMQLSGRIAYALNDMCWRKEFDSFNVVRAGYSATLDGGADYCFAAGARSGQMQISVAGPSGPFDMLLEFDAGNGNAVIRRGEVQTVCHFEMDDGVAVCETD